MWSQWKVVAFATVSLAIGPGLKPVNSQQQFPTTPSATIEPSVPVVVEMGFSSVTGMGSGGTARLEMVVQSDTAIPDLSVDVVLPEGVQVGDGTPIRGLKAALGAGGQKRYEMPLVADRHGAFGIRAEISFHLSDGRAFKIGQGAVLRLEAPPPEGRINAGAYEFRGVPLEDLRR